MKKFAFIAAAMIGASAFAQSSYTPVTREAPGGQNVNGQIIVTSTALSLTNGQVISVGDYPVILVDASAQESETVTNTFAAAASAKVGATFTIINVGASNDVLIADSAPAYNTGATLGLNDSATYFVRATNAIVQTGTSNN
jgi:hypothetical protein